MLRGLMFWCLKCDFCDQEFHTATTDCSNGTLCLKHRKMLKLRDTINYLAISWVFTVLLALIVSRKSSAPSICLRSRPVQPTRCYIIRFNDAGEDFSPAFFLNRSRCEAHVLQLPRTIPQSDFHRTSWQNFCSGINYSLLEITQSLESVAHLKGNDIIFFDEGNFSASMLFDLFTTSRNLAAFSCAVAVSEVEQQLFTGRYTDRWHDCLKVSLVASRWFELKRFADIDATYFFQNALSRMRSGVVFARYMQSQTCLSCDVLQVDQYVVDHVNKQGRHGALRSENIHVIMCVFDRGNLFKRAVFSNVLNQSYAGRVYLHVCDNGNNSKNWLHLPELHVSTKKVIKFYKLPINIHGFARFIIMKKVLQTTYVPYFIMIDDDVIFGREDVLATIHAQRRPETYASWWGRNFIEGKPYSVSSIEAWHLVRGLKPDVTSFHYGGTGLSIIDSQIIKYYDMFLARIPREYRYIEDIWLSYVVNTIGWRVQRLFLKDVRLLDYKKGYGSNSDTSLVEATAQWKKLAATKDVMLNELRQCGWRV